MNSAKIDSDSDGRSDGGLRFNVGILTLGSSGLAGISLGSDSGVPQLGSSEFRQL